MKNRYLALSILLILAALAVTAFYYSELPSTVPMHWNAAGEVNGHGPRWMVWLIGPGMMVAALLLGLALPWLAPQRFDVSGFESTYRYMNTVLVGLF